MSVLFLFQSLPSGCRFFFFLLGGFLWNRYSKLVGGWICGRLNRMVHAEKCFAEEVQGIWY